MIARDPHTWCKTYFRTDVACEAVENGIAECFNAIILDARKKPLLAMFEEIRLYMMDRFYHMLQKAEKWESVVCPAAIKNEQVWRGFEVCLSIFIVPCYHYSNFIVMISFSNAIVGIGM